MSSSHITRKIVLNSICIPPIRSERCHIFIEVKSLVVSFTRIIIVVFVYRFLFSRVLTGKPSRGPGAAASCFLNFPQRRRKKQLDPPCIHITSVPSPSTRAWNNHIILLLLLLLRRRGATGPAVTAATYIIPLWVVSVLPSTSDGRRLDHIFKFENA